MKLPIFNYTLVKELPISALNLKQFATHRRLKVFYQKGLVCPHCGRKGTKLILKVMMYQCILLNKLI